jgi:geranylgeranyl pyrophosphate synthase
MEEIHHYKTGALIAACCETGAVVAGCSREQIYLFSCFGYKLGLLFQISDDILDVTSTSEELGKPVGSDLESAKSTYVSLLGLVGAKEALSVVKKNCLETLQQLPYNTKNLAELIEFTAERKS